LCSQFDHSPREVISDLVIAEEQEDANWRVEHLNPFFGDHKNSSACFGFNAILITLKCLVIGSDHVLKR
jgi:hypothetical protein